MSKKKVPIILIADKSSLKNVETPWLFEGLCPIIKSRVPRADNLRSFADASKTLLRQIDCNRLVTVMAVECLRNTPQRP